MNITKILKYIYILFAGLFIINPILYLFLNERKYIIMIPFVILFALAFIYVYRKKINLTKKSFNILLIISILIRIALIFVPIGDLYGDPEFFYSNASSFAIGDSISTNVSIFPYLYSYIALLGSAMRVFGISYKTVIILNLIIELLGAYIIYLILKMKYSKNICYKGILIYMFNPLSYLWVIKSLPIVTVNTLIILSFYIYEIFNKEKDIKSKIIYSILLGFVLSFANAFRPVMIIFIIALAIIMIMELIKKNKIILLFLITIVVYLISNQIILNIVGHNIGVTVPKNSGGWSMYVGANYESNGQWNRTDDTHFFETYDKTDNITVHKIMQEEAIERYKNLGLKSFKLLYKKSIILSAFDYATFGAMDILLIPKHAILVCSYIAFMIMLILNIKNIIIDIKTNDSEDLIYLLFIMGLFSANLLVEVSVRYFAPLLLPLFIYGVKHLDKDNPFKLKK